MRKNLMEDLLGRVSGHELAGDETTNPRQGVEDTDSVLLKAVPTREALRRAWTD